MTRSGRRTRLSLSQGRDGRLVVNGTIGTRSRQRTLLATMVEPEAGARCGVGTGPQG